METSNRYSSLAIATIFTTINLIAVFALKTKTHQNTLHLHNHTSQCNKKILSYSCILFLLLSIDLSREELARIHRFPFGFFIFLMSFSIGLIIFGLGPQIAHQISELCKIILILCYTLMENNVCISIIFTKNEGIVLRENKATLLLEFLWLCSFSFMFHYGIFHLVLEVWGFSQTHSHMNWKNVTEIDYSQRDCHQSEGSNKN